MLQSTRNTSWFCKINFSHTNYIEAILKSDFETFKLSISPVLIWRLTLNSSHQTHSLSLELGSGMPMIAFAKAVWQEKLSEGLDTVWPSVLIVPGTTCYMLYFVAL